MTFGGATGALLVAAALVAGARAAVPATATATDGPLEAALADLGARDDARRRDRGARELEALGPAASAALVARVDPRSPLFAEAKVRVLAIAILTESAGADADAVSAALRRAATDDPAWEAREAAVRALAPKGRESLETLLAAAADPIYVVRRAAARALASSSFDSDARARAALERLESDPDPDVADAARRAGLPDSAARILDAAEKSPAAPKVPAATVAHALALGRGDAAVARFERWAARTGDADLRLLAADRLARLGSPRKDAALEAALDAGGSGRPPAERTARRLLARGGERAAALALERLASPETREPRVRAFLLDTIVAALRANSAPALGSILERPTLERPARLAIRQALASLPGGLGLPFLMDELAAEDDPAERLRLVEAFALRADDALAARVLEPALGDESRAVRFAALARLVASGRRDLLASAPDLLADSPEESVLRRFLRWLPPFDPEAPAALLAPLLAHGVPSVREEALVALGNARRASRDDVRAACAAALEEKNSSVRLVALNVLATRLEDESDATLRRIAAAPGDEAPRLLAVRRLGPRAKIDAANAAALERIALDAAASDALRHGAIRALGESGSDVAARALRAALSRSADRAVAIRSAGEALAASLADAILAIARDATAPPFDRIEAVEALGRVPAAALPLDAIAPFLAEKGALGFEIASAAVRALGDRGDPAAFPLLAPLLDGAERDDESARAERSDVLSALARIGSPAAFDRLAAEVAIRGEDADDEEFRVVLGALRGAPEAEVARRLAERGALPPGDPARLSLPERSLEAIARERRTPAVSPLTRFALEKILETFPSASAADRRAAGELGKEAIRRGDAAEAARFLQAEAAAGLSSGAFEDEDDPFDARFPSLATGALAALFSVLAADASDAGAIDAAAADFLGGDAAADRGALVTAGRALLDAGRADAASRAAMRALEADPLDRDALRLAAEASLALDRGPAAAESLEALVFSPGGTSGTDGDACAELARNHFERGEKERALAFLREAALRDPEELRRLGDAGAFAGVVSASELKALLAPYRR